MIESGGQRTALITGPTHGIGKATAKAIAAAGFRTVLVCRDAQAGARLRDALTDETGNAAIHVVRCDLSVFASVRAAAAETKSRNDVIDLFVNNAGIISPRAERSADGFELCFATNHLGPFLLTGLLEPLLADNARVVNVASISQFRARLDLDNVDLSGKFDPVNAYARSKLANVMFTLDLAERFGAGGRTANCLHPGTIGTNIVPGQNALFRLASWIFQRLFPSPEDGAATSIHVALSDDVAGMTGQYFDKDQQAITPAPAALDRDQRMQLWQFSERATGFEWPAPRTEPAARGDSGTEPAN